MMSHERDRLWVAYLDGELSARQAADFHQTISPKERERLAAEGRLEKALVDRLTIGSECPPEIWRRVKGRIDARARTTGLSRLTGRRAQLAAGLAVAAVALVAIMIHSIDPKPSRGNLLEIASDVKTLARETEVAGEIEEVRRFMLEHGVDLPLQAMPSAEQTGGHGVQLLGARVARYSDGDGMVLLFSCCGDPIKLILAVRDTGLARELQASKEKDSVQTTRVIGRFFIAAVGRHDAKEVLDLLG